jgi:cytochrome c oxidase accessory protein FixG
MCPYARFQSVMFDRDTLVIAYDAKRGEPRGARSRSVDREAAGIGDCVDCRICVQVCPTGIDIREGLQYECIGCAACIDGCDQVMDRMGYPRGLIRYASENSMERGDGRRDLWKRVLRPRTLVYAALLLGIAGSAAAALYLRNPLKVDVMRDRGALAREASPGVVENVYRVQVMNTDETPRELSIDVAGLPGLRVANEERTFALRGGEARVMPLRVQAAADAAPPGSHPIDVIVTARDGSATRHEHSTFILPR